MWLKTRYTFLMKLWLNSTFMLFLSLCIWQNAIGSLSLDKVDFALTSVVKLPTVASAPLMVGGDKISSKYHQLSFFAFSPMNHLERAGFLVDRNFFYLPIHKFIQEREYFLII